MICMALAVVGFAAVVVGAALVWSVGVACLVGGSLTIASAGLLYDPKADS